MGHRFFPRAIVALGVLFVTTPPHAFANPTCPDRFAKLKNFFSKTAPAETKDSQAAATAQKFKDQYISYELSGKKTFARVDAVDEDGTLRVTGVDGMKSHLRAGEIETAEISQSSQMKFEFERQQRSRITKGFEQNPGDATTVRFREKWREGGFESVRDSDESIISYATRDGTRLPARALMVLKDGRLKIRTTEGTEKILDADELVTARMASSSSARNFLEIEKDIKQRPIRQFSADIDRIAPKVEKISGNQYRGSYVADDGGYWRQWLGVHTDTLPQQGWKIHVSAKPENAARIAESLLPELRKRKLLHKVVQDIERYAARTPANSTQAGKFIQIYTKNDQEAKEIAVLVEQVVKKLGLDASDFIAPPGELAVSPGVFARYGRFDTGLLEDASGKRIQGTMDKIRLPNGTYVPDQRGIAAPAGIPNPF